MGPTNKFMLKILVLFGVVFSVSVWTLKQVEENDSQRLTSVFLRKRAELIIRDLPLGAKTQAHALYIGTSELEGLFDTRLIDEALQKENIRIRSYNLGMRSAPMPLLQTMVERLVQEYKTQQIPKARYVVFKVPLARMTKTADRNFEEESFAPVMATLSSSEMIFESLKKDFVSGLKLAANKYLFDGHSRTSGVQPVKSFFERANLVDRNLSEDFFSLWRRNVFFEPIYWNESRQGLYAWGLPLSENYLNSAILVKKMDPVRNWGYEFFNRCCDLLGLDISDSNIQILQKIIKNLQQISEQVIIIHIQEEPSYASLRTPEQEAKITALLQNFSSEARIIDFRDKVALTDSDYIDFQHLNSSGFKKLVPVFASEISKGLQK